MIISIFGFDVGPQIHNIEYTAMYKAIYLGAAAVDDLKLDIWHTVSGDLLAGKLHKS